MIHLEWYDCKWFQLTEDYSRTISEIMWQMLFRVCCRICAFNDRIIQFHSEFQPFCYVISRFNEHSSFASIRFEFIDFLCKCLISFRTFIQWMCVCECMLFMFGMLRLQCWSLFLCFTAKNIVCFRFWIRRLVVDWF